MKESLKITFWKGQSHQLMTVFCALTLISILVGIGTEFYFLMALPLVFLGAFLAILDFKMIFWLLLAAIPFSMETDFASGFSIDLPDEPLMMILMGIYVLFILKPSRFMSDKFIRHPITIVLLVHLLWILATAFTSQNHLVSFKYFAAKLWYVTTFYFLAASLVKSDRDWKTVFWLVFIPLVITVVYVLVRHAGMGFSFKSINKMVLPFYRNHVNYACLLSLFMPLIWYASMWYKRFSWKWWVILGGAMIILLGIQFSYTRAAYVALMGAVGASFIIQFRLVKYVLAAGTIAAIVFVVHVQHNNKYLDYAPDFNKTITHENFGNLISATSKGEDISTMERVYRWVAGMHMVRERPGVGFGPGNFSRFYRGYAVTNFKTYVSDNEDNSGVHSYYLMTAIEQGIIGLVIFLAMVFLVLLKGESIYHQTTKTFRKRQVMSVMLSFIVILTLLLINDMVETDKVGTFFFFCMAILVNADLKNHADANALESAPASK